MNVFIDCGTQFGEGIKAHVKLLSIDEKWKIYCFEANPFTFQYLNFILKKDNYSKDYSFFKFPFLVLSNKAV